MEEVATTDIESDDIDVFQKKKNFEEIATRLEKHRFENSHLKGNDYAYNVYVRKLERLARTGTLAYSNHKIWELM